MAYFFSMSSVKYYLAGFFVQCWCYIYSLCDIIHMKTSSVISVSTWRLDSDESCRYILSYAVLAGPGYRSERSHFQIERKNLTLTGSYLLGYIRSHTLFHSRLGYFESFQRVLASQ